MDELIYAMYEYAERSRMPLYLAKGGRNKKSDAALEIEASNLRETLSGDGKEQLDELLLDLFQAQDARLEAMFLAGFSLGQEFSRL